MIAHYLFKQYELASNIEELVFWGGVDDHLHNAKRELTEQMNKFHISIKASNFFVLNHQFLASVRKIIKRGSNFSIFESVSLFFS